jgi:hypothetical protein
MSQSIGLPASFSWAVDNLEVEMGKVFGPMCLVMVEELGRHKVFKVLVVTKDLDGMQCSLEFRSLFLESPNNSHNLLVVDFIVTFGWGVFL